MSGILRSHRAFLRGSGALSNLRRCSISGHSILPSRSLILRRLSSWHTFRAKSTPTNRQLGSGRSFRNSIIVIFYRNTFTMDWTSDQFDTRPRNPLGLKYQMEQVRNRAWLPSFAEPATHLLGRYGTTIPPAPPTHLARLLAAPWEPDVVPRTPSLNYAAVQKMLWMEDEVALRRCELDLLRCQSVLLQRRGLAAAPHTAAKAWVGFEVKSTKMPSFRHRSTSTFPLPPIAGGGRLVQISKLNGFKQLWAEIQKGPHRIGDPGAREAFARECFARRVGRAQKRDLRQINSWGQDVDATSGRKRKRVAPQA